MTLTTLAPALVLFLVPLAYSPGPGNLFFAASGARFGFAACLPALAGYHLATVLVTLAIGAGMGAALVQSGLSGAVRWVGAGYVLYLAAKFWFAPAVGAGSAPVGGAVGGAGGGAGTAARHGITAGDGAMLLLFNPKAYVIIALMFSQFLPSGSDAGARTGLLIWISVIFTANNLVAFVLWTLAGDRLGRIFGDPARATAINRGFAVVLAACAIWLAVG